MTNRPPMRVQVRLPGAPQSPVDRRRLLVIGGIWLLSLVLAVLGGCWMATPRDAQGRSRHRYLYFPDEGHWIQGRGNAQVWYETFLGFLDEHVRGTEWERPATLG